jgi:putative oxidoreductase
MTLPKLNALYSPAALFARIYIAHVFFSSGLLKLYNWQGTIFLFKNEYKVLLLNPEIAAYLGTAAEITLPIFVALGLGTRLPILALFFFNITAALSYPYLLTDAGACALKDHILWGWILLFISIHGSGFFSIDRLIQAKWKQYQY